MVWFYKTGISYLKKKSGTRRCGTTEPQLCDINEYKDILYLPSLLTSPLPFEEDSWRNYLALGPPVSVAKIFFITKYGRNRTDEEDLVALSRSRKRKGRLMDFELLARSFTKLSSRFDVVLALDWYWVYANLYETFRLSAFPAEKRNEWLAGDGAL